MSRDSLPDAETVRETLQLLRAASDPHRLPVPPPQDEELSLLTAILQLPEGSDPLGWLAAQRSDHVAQTALRDVLGEVLPPTFAPLGGSLARVSPRQALSLRRDIRLFIDNLDFDRDGFAIAVHLRLPLERAPADERGWRLPFWPGFERVTDDRGYRYLIQGAEFQGETRTQWWHRGWYRERLRMTCYPAVAAGASTLTFSALPAILAYRLTRRSGDSVQLPDEPLSDVAWSVTTPPVVGAAGRAR